MSTSVLWVGTYTYQNKIIECVTIGSFELTVERSHGAFSIFTLTAEYHPALS